MGVHEVYSGCTAEGVQQQVCCECTVGVQLRVYSGCRSEGVQWVCMRCTVGVLLYKCVH